MRARTLAHIAIAAAAINAAGTVHAEDIYFTTPALYTFNQTNNPIGFPFEFAEAGSVSRLDCQTGNTELVQGDLAFGAAGLAADLDGSLYAAVITSDTLNDNAHFAADLVQITDEGPVTLATLVDEPGFGGVVLNGLDLAFGPDGHLYYITPQLYGFQHAGTIDATVGRFDLENGTTETIATVDAGLAGLAFSPDGHLYAGSIPREHDRDSDGISAFELLQINIDTHDTTTVATLIDGADTIIGVTNFNFDIAINAEGQVYFNTPTIFELDILDLTGPAGCNAQECTIAFPGDIISIAGVSMYDPASGTIAPIVQTDSPGTAGVAITEDGTLLYGDSDYFGINIFSLAPGDEEPVDLGLAFDPAGRLFFLETQRFEMTAFPHVVAGLVRIPDELAADLNDDGTVTIIDLLLFLELFLDDNADLDGDGDTSILDLLIYLDQYLAGL